MPLFELEEGTSRKFYRIELHGLRVHLHWGRIGTEGEHQVLTHGTEQEARAEYDRQLHRRSERGYRLVVDEDVPHDPESRERARLAKTAALSENPRFLFVHRRAQRFSWVEAMGDTLVTAEGPLADEATLEPRSEPCGSPAAALRKRDALVAKLLATGFELETFGAKEVHAPKPRPKKPGLLVGNSALERVIAESPFDDERWLVLEDWLLEHPEDPREELVRLDKAGQRSDAAQARGKLLPVLLGQKHVAIGKAIAGAEWRAGFLLACSFTEPKRNAEVLLVSLLESPAASLLRELELELELPLRVTAMCVRIAQSPCVRSLRRLSITSRWRAGTRAELDAEILVPLVRLEELRTKSPEFRLRNMAHLAGLHSLAVTVDSSDELANVLEVRMPALRELALDLRWADRSDESEESNLVLGLAPLLAGTAVPALVQLKIECAFRRTTESIIAALRQSALLSQLRVLSLGNDTVVPAAHPGFEHLESLELPGLW